MTMRQRGYQLPLANPGAARAASLQVTPGDLQPPCRRWGLLSRGDASTALWNGPTLQLLELYIFVATAGWRQSRFPEVRKNTNLATCCAHVDAGKILPGGSKRTL